MPSEIADSRELREQMSRLAEQADWPGLLALVRRMADCNSSPADFTFAAARLRKMGEDGARAAGLRHLRTYIARSVTVEPFLPYLVVHAAAAGFFLETRIGSYGAFIDDLMNPAGELCTFAPALVLFFSDVEDVAAETDQAASRLAGMLEAFRRNSDARLLVQGLLLPDLAAAGDVIDANSPAGELAAIAAINRTLADACNRIGSAVYFDQDRLAARHGRRLWRDDRMFLSARVPVAARWFDPYAQALVRHIRALYLPPRKLLCTDLDDTFWGGIVGEDGPEGIQTGAAFPGNSYAAYQNYLKGLSERGVLLAIASRNNENDVREAFRLRAGDLALTLDDFVSVKIGWDDKALSLRAMAEELSLGLDSFVFVDDSPAECAAIRHALPDVLVVEASRTEPWTLPTKISGLGAFDSLAVTADDRRRTGEYRAQAKRAELERTVGSREEFLQSLQIVCTVGDGLGANLPRTVQLINKTNQFNLTTRRHSEADVERLARQPGSQVLALRVRDCFGDAGLVGVAICLQHGDAAYIDTFLLSCRVIGRGIETALLACLAAEARRRGAVRLFGEYAATPKNNIAAGFYTRHGFAETTAAPPPIAGNGLLYTLDLQAGLPAAPAWITMEEYADVTGA
jgi:FkbH-like protein